MYQRNEQKREPIVTGQRDTELDLSCKPHHAALVFSIAGGMENITNVVYILEAGFSQQKKKKIEQYHSPFFYMVINRANQNFIEPLI